MMNRIEKFADNLKAESRTLADRAIHGLRTAGLETAELLTRTKRPVHAIADTGIKLNNLSHKSIDQLLKQQVAVLDDIIDGSAERLEKAARARTVRTLIDGQFAALPKTRDHAVKNAKKTVSLVRDTGDAFGDLFKDVVVDIASARKPAVKRGRPAAKKAAGRKPAAKKASAKKAPAKKAAAKKRTARKASAKKAAETSSQSQAA